MKSFVQDEYRMLSRLACEKIKGYIAEKHLKAGDRLPTERNLAEELEVSRPVIREALGTLEALGLIIKKQGKGIFLKDQNFSVLFNEMMGIWQQDESSFDQLLNFRTLLEQTAVEQIIEHAGEADYLRLYALIAQSENKSISLSEFIKLDYLFHRELLALTGNPLFIQLTDVINKYFHQLESNRKTDGSIPGFRYTVEEHRAIVELLQAKDSKSAAQLIKLHLTERKLGN